MRPFDPSAAHIEGVKWNSGFGRTKRLYYGLKLGWESDSRSNHIHTNTNAACFPLSIVFSHFPPCPSPPPLPSFSSLTSSKAFVVRWLLQAAQLGKLPVSSTLCCLDLQKNKTQPATCLLTRPRSEPNITISQQRTAIEPYYSEPVWLCVLAERQSENAAHLRYTSTFPLKMNS